MEKVRLQMESDMLKESPGAPSVPDPLVPGGEAKPEAGAVPVPVPVPEKEATDQEINDLFKQDADKKK